MKVYLFMAIALTAKRDIHRKNKHRNCSALPAEIYWRIWTRRRQFAASAALARIVIIMENQLLEKDDNIQACPECGQDMPSLMGKKDSVCRACGYKESCCY